MAYPKEIAAMVKLIPKEHHKNINKIINFYYKAGVQDTQSLIKQIADIRPNEINEHGVYHFDEIAGG